MTGSTPARAEDRDPSPTEVRKVPVVGRSDSSDEVSPWDERCSPKKRNPGVLGLMEGAGEMMTDLNCFKAEDDGLEDGDLPSLSRPARGRPEQRREQEEVPDDEPGGLLPSRNKSTKRALNPPSQAGLLTVEERRLEAIRNRDSPGTSLKRAAFFQQLDPPTPSDTDGTFEDEGPDDELAAERHSQDEYDTPQRPDQHEAPQRPDEVVDGEDEYQNLYHNTSSTEAEPTCFDLTLNTISQMCGMGEDTAAQPIEHKWSEPHGDKWIDIDNKGEQGEEERVPANPTRGIEQTAIEVEYVSVAEPMRAPENESPPRPRDETPPARSKSMKKEESASKWGTDRKNAYLAAMARKAKKDFEESEGKNVRAESPRDPSVPGSVVSEDGTEVDEKSVEDVYSSFNPMERRKFLKLINSGVSSTDACNQILSDREENEKKKKKTRPLKGLFFRKKKSEKEQKVKEGTPKSEKSAASADKVTVVADDRLDTSVDIPTPGGESETDYGDLMSPESVLDDIDATASARTPPRTPPGAASLSSSMESSENTSNSVPSPAGETPEGTPQHAPRQSTPRSAASAALPVGTPPVSTQGETPKSEPASKLAPNDPGYRPYDMAVASNPLEDSYDEDDGGAVFLSSDSSSDGSEDAVHPMGAKAAAAAGAATAATTAAVIAPSHSGESSDVPFEKSGNNYYDAVRKELPEEEEDDEDEFESYSKERSTPTKGSRLASLRPSPRGHGFKSLKDKNVKGHDAEYESMAGGSEDLPSSASKRRILGIPIEYESMAAGSEDLPSSASKRRILGIPIPAGKESPGFSALEDQDDSGTPLQRTQPNDAPHGDDGVLDRIENDAPQGDDEVLDRIEKELLRPGPISVEGGAESNDDSFSLKTPKAMAQAESTPKDKIQVAGDVGLENYFESTASYSSPGIPTHDQASVVSGKSEWTARTGYTGASTVYTQSSRKRHKGAAKKRMAKAKAAEAKSQGWHESIVAAAASTNRVWDPQRGWIDYEDPADAMHQVKSSEKLRVSLDGVAVRSVRKDDPRTVEDTSQARSAPVPFPPGWEKDRNDMIGVEKKPVEHRGAESSNVDDKSPTGDVAQHATQESGVSTDSGSSREDQTSSSFETNSTDKIRVSLGGVALHSSRESDSDRSTEKMERGAPVPVPFPPEWEKERKEMVKRGGVPYEGRKPAERGDSISDTVEFPPAQTAAVGTEAKEGRWSSRGVPLTSPYEGRKTSTSDTVEFPPAQTAAVGKEAKEGRWSSRGVPPTSPYEGRKTSTSDTVEFPPAQAAAVGKEAKEGRWSSRGVPPTSPQSEETRNSALKHRDALDDFIEKSATPSANHSELSMGDSDQAVASNGGIARKKGIPYTAASTSSSGSERLPAQASVNASSESTQSNKYVQLGDNGSVRSAYAQDRKQKQSSQDTKEIDGPRDSQTDSRGLGNAFFAGSGGFPRTNVGEDETAPLLNADRDLSASDIDQAPQIDVVKEKCDKDDLNLFSGDGVDSVEEYASSEGIRTPPRKDRSGPVDLDDLDENIDAFPSTSNSEDGADQAWATEKRESVAQKLQASSPSGQSGSLFSGDGVDSVEEYTSSEGIRTPPRKDRSGPVDLDDLDENIDALPSDSEDGADQAADQAWATEKRESVAQKLQASSPSGQSGSIMSIGEKPLTPVPKLGRSKRDTSSPSGQSGSIMSIGEKPSTPLPKLGRSKRDTSPVHERTPVVAASSAPVDRATTIERVSTPTDESTVTSATSSVKLRAQQWESMSSNKSKSTKRPDPPSHGDRKVRTEVFRKSESATPKGAVMGESEEPLRSNDNREIPAEWKSFFGKKVRAESAAALQAETRRREPAGGALTVDPYKPKRPKYVSAHDDEEYFSGEDGAFPTSSTSRRSRRHNEEEDSLFRFDESRDRRSASRRAADEFPDISPIHTQDEDEIVMEEVESNTGAVDKNSSFLQRLQTCAAPMLPRQACGGDNTVPSSHLAFMRTNPAVANGSGSSKPQGSDRFVPPALCGRPDVIVEEGDNDESIGRTETDRSTRSGSQRSYSKRESPRKSRARRGSPRSSPRSIGSEVRSSSSVASEDFGQKTAYLEALAMKAAVSNPKRSGSSGRRRSTGTASDVSSGSKSSEAWQAFLERKRAAGGINSSGSNTESVSKAAEKYAAEKVEEMMSVMSSRSKSVPRSHSREDDPKGSSSALQSPYELRHVTSDGDRPLSTGRAPRKSDSAKAAEELAAARVEAMMAAMKSTTLDEGEI